jgi:hypothetical protein
MVTHKNSTFFFLKPFLRGLIDATSKGYRWASKTDTSQLGTFTSQNPQIFVL